MTCKMAKYIDMLSQFVFYRIALNKSACDLLSFDAVDWANNKVGRSAPTIPSIDNPQ